ncbi:hypothetical protein BT96DRAFT_914058 [Gymnopus androsaceus JB14]|uniref:Helicase ATP-binding domain-containing protein n=1 Tax=Gymnopus androsaceus JB14 TaxID=1447944 RepID=A0A6A4ID62_9AGAR|nr:hypothetical protein BT96DRAFT_914058 [Gymnopus androsaceus JB14]
MKPQLYPDIKNLQFNGHDKSTLKPTNSGLGEDASPNPRFIPNEQNEIKQEVDEVIHSPKQHRRSTNTSTSPSQRRSGPRQSEPNIAAQMQSLSLNIEKATPTKPQRKARNSEPPRTGSFASPKSESNREQQSFSSKPQSPISRRPRRSNSNEKNVFELLNEHNSWDYSSRNLDTSLKYSSFELKPHQAHARDWMAAQEDAEMGGLLADEMGLGKTIQMIVCIIDHRLKMQVEGKAVGPTLIVGPKSIILQWEDEIQRMIYPSRRLKVIIYHGSRRSQRFPSSILFGADIVITTYGTLSSDWANNEANKSPRGLFEIPWLRVVLDEAHEIRNPDTKKAKASFAVSAPYKWCLTGTPLQNTIMDLHSVFRFVGIEDFSDKQWYQREIERPIMKGSRDEAEHAQRLLKPALQKIMLRRLKTDLVNGRPILLLPDISIKDVNVELSELERKFYDLLEQRMHEILADLSRKVGSKSITFFSTAFVLLLRLRQACLHPSLLVSNSQQVEDEDEKDEDDTEDESMYLKKAVQSYLATCILCGKSNQSEAHRRSSSTKITFMLDLLHEIKARPGNEKTIVFSTFTSMLNIIEHFMQENGIKFVRLDGTMSLESRKDALNNIQRLNLTSCNNVILFDLWWNPAVEEQAFGRAHRMGQNKKVHIYRLIVSNSVEERIVELQDRKKKLATETLDRSKMGERELSKDQQILHLLHYR